MKSEKPGNVSVINKIFVMALACCIGGVVISGVTAHLDLPLIAWTALAIGVAGFITMFALFIVVLGSEASRLLRQRAGAQA